MSQKIEKILKNMPAAITKATDISSTTNPNPAPSEPRRVADGLGDPDCPICHGLGYISDDLPVGHPQFGKARPCTCQLDNLQLARAAQLRQESNAETLAGKTFVLTGALRALTRDAAADRIRARGGSVTDRVSPTTDYVVVGAEPGEKLARARALGRPTLREDAFLALVS